MDSSGWLSTKSATFLMEEALTWPSMRAMSMRCSMSLGPASMGAPPTMTSRQPERPSGGTAMAGSAPKLSITGASA